MTEKQYKDTNPKYWKEYSNLQHVKHELINNYLQGWFPILSTWQGRIMYLETHAGRGIHATGDSGSPIVALNTLLTHSSFDRIVERCQVVFYFIENDSDNMNCLDGEICKIGNLHSNIIIKKEVGDSFEILSDLIQNLKSSRERLAPAFIFVDPYGFKIDGNILRELMQFERVELFINVMWRELDMAMAQSENEGMRYLLDSIFGSENWKEYINADKIEFKLSETMEFIQNQLNAKWSTYFRMLGDNNQTRYVLVHLTNNDRGRDLMKDCMWKICPDGDFYAKKTDSISQLSLLQPSPDFSLLRKWVIDRLRIRPMRWQDLIDAVRPEIWRKEQLNEVVRELRKSNILIASDYSIKFAPKNNPLLTLSDVNEKSN